MNQDKNTRYLTFPVSFLNNSFLNITTVCNNIFDFAIYKHSLKMEFGTEQDRMKAAVQYYGITPGSLPSMTQKGKELVNNTPEKAPLTSIGKEMLFDFYKNEKTEFDIACLCAYLAIKSILGKRDFCKTNKQHVLARMFGFNTVNDLPKKQTPLMKKYANRYHIDKVLFELQSDWYLKLIGNHTRGFYLSFNMTLEKLATISVEAKKSTKELQLRNAKKEAIQKAKEYAFA